MSISRKKNTVAQSKTFSMCNILSLLEASFTPRPNLISIIIILLLFYNKCISTKCLTIVGLYLNNTSHEETIEADMFETQFHLLALLMWSQSYTTPLITLKFYNRIRPYLAITLYAIIRTIYPQSLWRNDARTLCAVTSIFNRHQALTDQIQQHKHFTGNTYPTHCISSILCYKLILSNMFSRFLLRPRLEFLTVSNSENSCICF